MFYAFPPRLGSILQICCLEDSDRGVEIKRVWIWVRKRVKKKKQDGRYAVGDGFFVFQLKFLVWVQLNFLVWVKLNVRIGDA